MNNPRGDLFVATVKRAAHDQKVQDDELVSALAGIIISTLLPKGIDPVEFMHCCLSGLEVPVIVIGPRK